MMKKYVFFVYTFLFLLFQSISLNHQYDPEHFFVHDSACAQCQFIQQTGGAQAPELIELPKINYPYSEILLTNSFHTSVACENLYWAEAPPSLI